MRVPYACLWWDNNIMMQYDTWYLLFIGHIKYSVMFATPSAPNTCAPWCYMPVSPPPSESMRVRVGDDLSSSRLNQSDVVTVIQELQALINPLIQTVQRLQGDACSQQAEREETQQTRKCKKKMTERDRWELYAKSEMDKEREKKKKKKEKQHSTALKRRAKWMKEDKRHKAKKSAEETQSEP